MTPAVPALLTGILCLGSPGVDDPQGQWPLSPDPEVVHGFDPPASPWGSGHRGVDLAGHAGQVVHAALGGQVLWAGMLAGRGVLVVGHGDTRTTYEPVTATVSVGDLVAAGDPIGILALSGSHCAPVACLHWGWLRGETYLDPLDLVGTEQIRLLPLTGLPESVVSARAPRAAAPAGRPTADLVAAAVDLTPAELADLIDDVATVLDLLVAVARARW